MTSLLSERRTILKEVTTIRFLQERVAAGIDISKEVQKDYVETVEKLINQSVKLKIVPGSLRKEDNSIIVTPPTLSNVQANDDDVTKVSCDNEVPMLRRNRK